MNEKEKLFKTIRYILIGAVILIISKYALSFGIALRLYFDNKEVISNITDLSNIDKSPIVHNVTKLDDKQEFENYLSKNNINIVTGDYYSLLIEKYNLIGYTMNDFNRLDVTMRSDIGTMGGQLGQQYLGYYFRWNESK